MVGIWGSGATVLVVGGGEHAAGEVTLVMQAIQSL